MKNMHDLTQHLGFCQRNHYRTNLVSELQMDQLPLLYPQLPHRTINPLGPRVVTPREYPPFKTSTHSQIAILTFFIFWTIDNSFKISNFESSIKIARIEIAQENKKLHSKTTLDKYIYFDAMHQVDKVDQRVWCCSVKWCRLIKDIFWGFFFRSLFDMTGSQP